MKMIDPTYLRYIHDGLNSGKINKENIAALPSGLIGLYDQIISKNLSVLERQKLLNQFAIWALLKKEVSTNFVANLTDQAEEDVVEFISTNSKWFNSPESGKYQLYHERFRAYLLQRIENIIEINNKLLENFLIKDEDNDNNISEITSYLQIFYGDHLFISSYYNTNNDKYYLLLSDYNSFIKQKQWIVKDNDLIRWNSNLAILASKEIDIPVLKNIIQYQDNILNKKIDLDNLLKNILNGDLNELNDILLFKPDETEKYLIVLSLVIRIIDFIDKIENENVPFDTKLIHTAINYLLKQLNDFNVTNDWLICNGLIEELNLRLVISSLTVGNIDVELSEKNYSINGDGDIPMPYGIGSNFDELEFYEYSSEIIAKNKSKDKLTDYIKSNLIGLIKHDIEPEYRGNLTDLLEIEKKILSYSIKNETDGIKLKVIIKEIRNLLLLTNDSDLNTTHDVAIETIIYELLKYDIKFLKTNWTSCFCNSIDYKDFFNYYSIIALAKHLDNWSNKNFFEKSWKTKKHMLHSAITASTLLCEKGESSTAINLYKETIDYYINYSYSNDKIFEIIKFIKPKKLSKNEINFIKYKIESLEYIHMSTLSAILCTQLDFLKLVSILNYDEIYLSSVSDNKTWSYEILKGISLRIGIEETERYLLKGLDTYVKVMGKFGFKDYDRESNRPKDNIWKIEWWVMSNFISIFSEFYNQLKPEFSLKDKNYKSLDNSLSFKKNSFYNKIENIFTNNNYSPIQNLYASIEEYKNQSWYEFPENESDVILNYKLNKKSTLLNYTSKQNDKNFINNIAKSIKLDI